MNQPMEIDHISNTDEFNRIWSSTQSQFHADNMYSQSNSTLGFAPFIPKTYGVLLPLRNNDCYNNIEQEREEYIKLLSSKGLDELMKKPIDEGVSLRDIPEIKEYTDIVKNLKGYLLKINERYNDIENRMMKSNGKPSAELIKEKEQIVTEYSSAMIKLKTLPKSVFNQRTCVICFESEIEYFIDPCGHTICGNCKESCKEMKRCHVCRGPLHSYKKLFL